MADASILSTGTWMIGFQRGLALDKLDAARAMVLNIDVDGEDVTLHIDRDRPRIRLDPQRAQRR